MTPLEIDKELARVIGYLPEHVLAFTSGIYVYRIPSPELHLFSHTDPTVIWPLAKHYSMVVYFSDGGASMNGKVPRFAGSPEAAVAMAIIRSIK